MKTETGGQSPEKDHEKQQRLLKQCVTVIGHRWQFFMWDRRKTKKSIKMVTDQSLINRWYSSRCLKVQESEKVHVVLS